MAETWPRGGYPGSAGNLRLQWSLLQSEKSSFSFKATMTRFQRCEIAAHLSFRHLEQSGEIVYRNPFGAALADEAEKFEQSMELGIGTWFSSHFLSIF